MFVNLLVISYIFFSILMVIISLELTKVNPDRNIFSINVELTSPFFLYRGVVLHHHRILSFIYCVFFKELWLVAVCQWRIRVPQSLVSWSFSILYFDKVTSFKFWQRSVPPFTSCCTQIITFLPSLPSQSFHCQLSF